MAVQVRDRVREGGGAEVPLDGATEGWRRRENSVRVMNYVTKGHELRSRLRGGYCAW